MTLSEVIKNPAAPRRVYIVLRGLSAVKTPEAKALLEQIVESPTEWVEGQGQLQQNWTPFLKQRAFDILKTR